MLLCHVSGTLQSGDKRHIYCSVHGEIAWSRLTMTLPVLSSSPLIGRRLQLQLVALALMHTCQLTQVAAGKLTSPSIGWRTTGGNIQF